MKTPELTGAALDWAVAKCEGVPVGAPAWNNKYINAYDYSTNWAQGGPIIEREGFCIQPFGGGWECFEEHRLFEDGHHHSQGPTPLIAAMRCYVASKLGDTVEIPQELIQ